VSPPAKPAFVAKASSQAGLQRAEKKHVRYRQR
jgi:hypothetical protein